MFWTAPIRRRISRWLATAGLPVDERHKERAHERVLFHPVNVTEHHGWLAPQFVLARCALRKKSAAHSAGALWRPAPRRLVSSHETIGAFFSAGATNRVRDRESQAWARTAEACRAPRTATTQADGVVLLPERPLITPGRSCGT